MKLFVKSQGALISKQPEVFCGGIYKFYYRGYTVMKNRVYPPFFKIYIIFGQTFIGGKIHQILFHNHICNYGIRKTIFKGKMFPFLNEFIKTGGSPIGGYPYIVVLESYGINLIAGKAVFLIINQPFIQTNITKCCAFGGNYPEIFSVILN